MRVLVLILVCLVMVMSVGPHSVGPQDVAAQDATSDSEMAPLMFDDFDYEATDDEAFAENGWIVRAGEGWPGVPDAVWRAENVSFLSDPDDAANTLLQMASSTDGTDTYQTQFCHQRKYYEGTYMARVRFSNAPETGPDGDQIVQTFYLISPQQFDMDPDYSEHDYEYLPNGGWGMPGNVLFATSWETFQLEPWIADNTSGIRERDYEGWHTLMIRIAEDEVRYFVDGRSFARHNAGFYPEVPMSINFNLWFINGGLLDDDEERTYVEWVDWVFFSEDTELEPEDIEALVETFRADDVTFTDTVPDWDPALESPCNF